MNPLIAMLDIKAKWLVHDGDTITPIHVPHDVKTYKDLEEYIRMFYLTAKNVTGHKYALTTVCNDIPLIKTCQWRLKSETSDIWYTITAKTCLPDGSID